jgi:hypothetical protein
MMSEIVKAYRKKAGPRNGVMRDERTGNEYAASSKYRSFLGPMEYRLAEKTSSGIFSPDVETMQKLNETINSFEAYKSSIARANPLRRQHNVVPNLQERFSLKRKKHGQGRKKNRVRQLTPSYSLHKKGNVEGSDTATRYGIRIEQLETQSKKSVIDTMGLSHLNGSFLNYR